MSEFPYHTTAAIARSERVSIEELRYLSCLAHAYYDKWRHNDRQRIDDLSRITALEAECALLKASLLEAEGREHEARLLTQDLSGKLAASEARVGVLTEALVPHIADLRRCAAILRTSELAEKFIGTADEFDRAAEELNAAIGSASHD